MRFFFLYIFYSFQGMGFFFGHILLFKNFDFQSFRNLYVSILRSMFFAGVQLAVGGGHEDRGSEESQTAAGRRQPAGG